MTEQINQGVSRRTVAKGIAWSVPAVAIASAAPAYAISPPEDGPIRLAGVACKLPGSSSDYSKGYIYDLAIVNETGPNPYEALIQITDVYVGGVRQTAVGYNFVNVNDQPQAGQLPPLPATGACADGGCQVPDMGSYPIVLSAPEGETHRVLLYTNAASNSANANVEVRYRLYDCQSSCAQYMGEYVTSATIPDAPPAQGSCTLASDAVFPLPAPVAY